MKFDWDQGNTKKSIARVPIAEVEAMFVADDTLISGDPFAGEKRFRAVGKNHEGRYIFVAFTIGEISGESHIRPSARYERRKKRK